MTLNQLNLGDSCIVKNLHESSDLYRRFLDLGIIPGTRIQCVLYNPFGDPKAYEIRGAVIAIRNQDAWHIEE